MLALVVAFSAQLSANRNSLTISVVILVFAWSLLVLKAEPSVRYRMSIPLSEPLNASNSTAENMILKRVGVRIYPYLTPFVTEKASELFPLSCTHAVIKLSNDGDEFFGAAVFCHDSPKAISADRVKHKLSRGQCSSITAVLLQTPCQQSHVPYRSRIGSLVRVHFRDGCWGDSEEIWLGSCPKLKVRRFCGDYP